MTWNGDEQAFIGLQFGAVIGYREQLSQNGKVYQNEYIARLIDKEALARGDFKVPELKKLKEEDRPALSPKPMNQRRRNSLLNAHSKPWNWMNFYQSLTA